MARFYLPYNIHSHSNAPYLSGPHGVVSWSCLWCPGAAAMLWCECVDTRGRFYWCLYENTHHLPHLMSISILMETVFVMDEVLWTSHGNSQQQEKKNAKYITKEVCGSFLPSFLEPPILNDNKAQEDHFMFAPETKKRPHTQGDKESLETQLYGILWLLFQGPKLCGDLNKFTSLSMLPSPGHIFPSTERDNYFYQIL